MPPRTEARSWQDVLAGALATPGAQSWRTVVRIGNAVARHTGALASVDRDYFLACLRRAMPRWPTELDRRCPAEWPEEWLTLAHRRVGETTQYDRWEVGICSDVRLALSDGSQGVVLRRRFVGQAISLRGQKRISIGEKGEPDLQGFLVLETALVPMPRLPVYLAVEVKTPDGVLTQKQEERRAATLALGGIHLVCHTIERAVLALVSERDRLVRAIGHVGI